MTQSAYSIREKAWNMLSGKWGSFALVWLVVIALAAVASPTMVLVLAILPMEYILYASALSIMRGGRSVELEDLFRIYGNDGLRAFLVLFLQNLFVGLWSLLFFFPGVVMSYAYAMAPYIIEDDDQISALDAIRKSKEMMRGHKWDLFCLDLSFIGWLLLVVCTFGFAILWVGPYMYAARAEFYRQLNNEADVEYVEAE